MASECVACRANAVTRAEGSSETYRLHVDCATCGSYDIKSGAWEYLEGLQRSAADFELLPFLRAHLRQATDRHELVVVTLENWRDLARSHTGVPVGEKLRKLLEYAAKRTSVGEWFYIENEVQLAAVADVRDNEELKFLLVHLNDRDLITYQPMPPPPNRRHADGSYSALENGVQLTIDGWETVAPLAGGVAGTCFVAMSLESALDSAYRDGILPALQEDCGYRAVRVDRVPHNDNITDRIIAGIRSAQFVVADFTGHRQGVYYEAGFAQGLGRVVIRTCHERDFEGLHFDTRQFLHLRWKTAADLRSTLADHVRATIGPARSVG